MRIFKPAPAGGSLHTAAKLSNYDKALYATLVISVLEVDPESDADDKAASTLHDVFKNFTLGFSGSASFGAKSIIYKELSERCGVTTRYNANIKSHVVLFNDGEYLTRGISEAFVEIVNLVGARTFKDISDAAPVELAAFFSAFENVTEEI